VAAISVAVAVGVGRFVVLVLGGIEDAVGEALRVLPADVVGRVGIEGRLVHAGAAGVEQVPQVGPQQLPLEVVRCFAIEAVDDDTANPARLKQGLEDLEIFEVDQDFFAIAR